MGTSTGCSLQHRSTDDIVISVTDPRGCRPVSSVLSFTGSMRIGCCEFIEAGNGDDGHEFARISVDRDVLGRGTHVVVTNGVAETLLITRATAGPPGCWCCSQGDGASDGTVAWVVPAENSGTKRPSDPPEAGLLGVSPRDSSAAAVPTGTGRPTDGSAGRGRSSLKNKCGLHGLVQRTFDFERRPSNDGWRSEL